MIRLDTTTRKLQAILAGAITTNNLPVTVSYADKTSSDYVGATQLTNTNGVTAVDICAAPAASTIRDIDYISARNSDTASATITFRYNDNATLYTIRTFTLSVGDQVEYTHGEGWKLLNSSGQIKTTGATQQPTRTVLTSGSSATYTTPSGATRLYVRMVGGGGGGDGSGTGAGSGVTGGNSSFGSLTANGGATGPNGGGAASGGDVNITGTGGSNPSGLANQPGGTGGVSPFGGGGAGFFGTGGGAGGNAATNSGSGGGGAGDGATTNSGGAGSAGGYLEKLIVSPSSTYTYTVGAKGTKGAAGTGGFAGGDGGAGLIIVDEYYD